MAVTLARTYFHGASVVNPSLAEVVPERLIVPSAVEHQFVPSFEQSMTTVAVTAPVPTTIAWIVAFGLSL